MKSLVRSYLLLVFAFLINNAVFAQILTPVILSTQVSEDYPNAVDLDIEAYNFTDLVSMQFVLKFDPQAVSFDSFLDFNLPGLSITAVNYLPPNRIVLSWISPNPSVGQTLADGTSFITIRFTPLVQGSCSFEFDLNSPVFPEFVNVNSLTVPHYLLDCTSGTGILSGQVFADENSDCELTAGESALGKLVVQVVSGIDTSYVVANSGGFFYYLIKPDDESLELSVLSPNGYWAGCDSPQTVEVTDPEANIQADLGAVALVTCAPLEIDITTPFLRRCFQSLYYVSYCNAGTVTAEGAEAVIEFDPFLSVTGSSIPWSNVEGNVYTFQLGDLETGECGSFTVQVLVSCDAELGQTHCTQAVIHPVDFCDPAPLWSGAQLAVKGSCDGDLVRFEIENVGEEPMDAPSGYIVIEDDMIKMMEPVDPLQPGAVVELDFPANGATWRVEVAQVSDFPAPSAPSATVEACDEDGDGQFSLGFVNMFPQDEEAPYLSVHCIENIGSWDPNDKAAFPAGYREAHLIAPDTRLEYLIRFQNTGTDTAFTVVIRDTLSQWLDPATLRLQAASHSHQLQVSGDGQLVVTFPDILLPDSTTNEPASHGFVQFSIDQRPGNPLGELIENRAGIYFDYNVPVITNTVFHTLGVDFVEIVNGVSEAGGKLQRLNAYPNPASASVWIGLPGEGLLRLFDPSGRELRAMKVQAGAFQLERNGLEAGLYWLVWEQGGKAGGIASVTFR